MALLLYASTLKYYPSGLGPSTGSELSLASPSAAAQIPPQSLAHGFTYLGDLGAVAAQPGCSGATIMHGKCLKAVELGFHNSSIGQKLISLYSPQCVQTWCLWHGLMNRNLAILAQRAAVRHIVLLLFFLYYVLWLSLKLCRQCCYLSYLYIAVTACCAVLGNLESFYHFIISMYVCPSLIEKL